MKKNVTQTHSITAKKRDYSKEPNRFTLKLLYNDTLVVTTDRNGNQRVSKRDFDFPFREPRYLGKNPSGLIQDKKNNPSKLEENLFENSWEAVEMGQKLIEIFRLKLKEGTEDFISYQNEVRPHMPNEHFTKDNYKKPMELPYEYFNNNKFTLVLVDNRSVRRDATGQTYNTKKLINQIDELTEKGEYEGLDGKGIRELDTLKKELKECYIVREIFRCSFSADDYSYDGTGFTPPLSMVWKDFNVYFRNPTPQAKKQGLNFTEIESYNGIINSLSEFKRQRNLILENLEEASDLRDNIRTASLEKSLAAINEKINYSETIYFKGLRSRIKEYLNLEDYTNRFLYPKEVHNDFFAYSSEEEIMKAGNSFS